MLRNEGPKPKDAGSDYPDFLYEACWGDRIKQVPHPYTENRVKFGDFLGWRDPPKGSSARFAQVYSGGTLCEGFGSREAVVYFSCDAEALDSPRIVDVKEGEVCKYEMHVKSAHACEG